MKNRNVFGLPMYPPFAYRFAEGDGDGDAAGAGDDKAGGTGDDKSGGLGGDGTHTIKVAGEEWKVTTGELVKLGEKSAGADARFEEAAKMRKEAEDSIRVADLMKKAETDDGAFREVGRYLGWTEDDIDQAIELRSGAGSKGDDDEGGQQAAPAELSDEDKESLRLGKQAALQQEKARVEEEMQNLLDTDDVLGKDKVKVDGARTALFKMIEADVVSRLARGERYGPELLSSSLQHVRQMAQGLGIFTGDGAEDPMDPKVRAKKAREIGLGPDSKDAAEAIQAREDIPRVPVTHPDYVDNLVARAMLNRKEE